MFIYVFPDCVCASVHVHLETTVYSIVFYMLNVHVHVFFIFTYRAVTGYTPILHRESMCDAYIHNQP